jgi:plasmid stabilization system protein ParE
MLPLRWTEQAVEHLGAIADFISASSPVYAEGVVHCIEIVAILHGRREGPGAPAA